MKTHPNLCRSRSASFAIQPGDNSRTGIEEDRVGDERTDNSTQHRMVRLALLLFDAAGGDGERRLARAHQLARRAVRKPSRRAPDPYAAALDWLLWRILTKESRPERHDWRGVLGWNLRIRTATRRYCTPRSETWRSNSEHCTYWCGSKSSPLSKINGATVVLMTSDLDQHPYVARYVRTNDEQSPEQLTVIGLGRASGAPEDPADTGWGNSMSITRVWATCCAWYRTPIPWL